MIAFRVDANQYTATGHAMRCASIAQELLEQGVSVTFIVADEDSKNFLQGKGFPVVCLHTNWQDMPSELPKLFHTLEQIKARWLVISSYQVTEEYLLAVKERVKTFYLDDMNEFVYPVDALLNYNIYAKELDYERIYFNRRLQLYLGTKYAPLRKQFQNFTPAVRSQVKDIFISTGGSDRYGVAQKIIQEISLRKQFDDVTLHVVSGFFATQFDVPKEMQTRVCIYKNVSDMAALMGRCDLAVTAGGSTNYELCACGLPSVSYSISDDQLGIVDTFERLGIMRYCGDIRDNADLVVSHIVDGLETLKENQAERLKISKKMKQLVDGNGAKRVAELLMK